VGSVGRFYVGTLQVLVFNIYGRTVARFLFVCRKFYTYLNFSALHLLGLDMFWSCFIETFKSGFDNRNSTRILCRSQKHLRMCLCE
jgi:hypothetical protein